MNRLLALLVFAAIAAPASAGWRCEIIKSDDGNSVSGTCGKVTTIKLMVVQPPVAPAPAAAAPAPAALKAEAVATPAAAASKTIGKDASGRLIFLK
jgi:hypothetical protein